MKTNRLLTSFLACMALWSAPVYADLATDGLLAKNTTKLVDFSDYYVKEIDDMRDELKKATNAKNRLGKIFKGNQAKSYMIATLSNTSKFPKYLGLDPDIQKIKNVKFGLKKDKINKALTDLKIILINIQGRLNPEILKAKAKTK